LSARTIQTKKRNKAVKLQSSAKNQQRKPNGSEQYTLATNFMAANVGIKIKQTANSKVKQRKPLIGKKKPLTEPSTSHRNNVPNRLKK
jgi:hypothetical protein